MAKLLVLLVIFCFIHNSISQAATCADGLYVTTSNPISDKGQCSVCPALCKTCTGASGCTTYVDTVKGLTSGTPICAAGFYLGATTAYNPTKDICDNCMEGCASCGIDYNICTSCKQGWDFDRKNLKCLRASLGLAAVVLALSVLSLLVGVISCICACKL